jgi:hypothetical protein
VHGVWSDDPGPGGGDEPAVVDLLDTWGIDLNLGALSTAKVNRSTVSSDDVDAFTRTDFCFDGRTRTSDLGLGLFEDERAGHGATWFDGALERAELDLRLTATVMTPDPDSGGVIGDLSDEQLDLIRGAPEEFDLIDMRMLGCTGQVVFNEKTLTGQLRRGTERDVAEVLRLAEQSAGGEGIPEPALAGVDAALYVAESDDHQYQALDAGLHVPIGQMFELRQPQYLRCGVGNQPFPGCHDLPTYDTTTTGDIQLEMKTDVAVLGDLDFEYLTEPVDDQVIRSEECSRWRFEDDCALRAVLHVDQVPGHLGVSGSLAQRPRDGFVDVELTLEDAAKVPEIHLMGVEFEYFDDYGPARLGDLSENGPGDLPLAWFDLNNADELLVIDAEVWMPRYGWSESAYDSTDCEGWTNGAQSDHVYPFGQTPSTWNTVGPREQRDLRPAYLHGSIDLNPDGDELSASRIEVEVDARVDRPGEYDHAPTGLLGKNWFDDPYRTGIKVSLDTGLRTEGQLWGVYPGLQEHIDEDTATADLETCIDIDVPVHLTWSEASTMRLGVDLLKATVSAADAEVSSGADVALEVEERLSRGLLSSNTRVGLWVHELKTWYHPLLKDWYTNVSDERMSVGFLDPDDLDLTVLPHDRRSIQDHFVSGWSATGTSGDMFYAEVLMQVLLHEDVEAVIAGDQALIDHFNAWLGMWERIDGSTDALISWQLPNLVPGSTLDNDDFDYETMRNCTADQSQAESDTTSLGVQSVDGTTLEIGSRWENRRVELFLIARYPNDEVRFVRELYDGDPGQKTCMLAVDGQVTFDHLTGRLQLVLDVDGTAKSSPAPNDWHSVTDGTYVFDASGNGWLEDDAPDVMDPVVAGQEVVLSPGTVPGAGEECVWHPGDGTRITPDDEDNDGSSATHTYAFPGTYQVLQLCYDGTEPPEEDQFQADVWEMTVVVEAAP